ncbi:MAG: DUF2130 domain-containing protein [Erysipelotrichaceae bacterium]|nr:DUF2130 domain-containing protein [Erysipelotrichaceae bacterium]
MIQIFFVLFLQKDSYRITDDFYPFFYDSILKQVRDKEFNDELKHREEEFERRLRSELENAKLTQQNAFDKQLAQKDQMISDLTNKNAGLEASVRNDEEKKYVAKIQQKEMELANLNHQLELLKSKHSLDVQSLMSAKDSEIAILSNKLENSTAENERQLLVLKTSYEQQLSQKDEVIAQYKDFKVRQSTKMVGESLEVHCSTEFEKLRPLFGKNVFFGKDNDSAEGSKGDFIYRESDDDGNEIVSIMFEMKNQMDDTEKKKKNEDHFNKLNKDRINKNCEFAVLVSMLEMDSELYNHGIVDVSYKYEKMYVIRPQFFIPMITILRNTAMNSLAYKKEISFLRSQSVDITNFEENMEEFKKGFSRNFNLAKGQFDAAIDEIDKAISNLQKVKDNLTRSENNLRLANDKAQDLTIKKLTKNAPSLLEQFEASKK